MILLWRIGRIGVQRRTGVCRRVHRTSSFRTPEEINSDLGIPVLAAIPREVSPLGSASYNIVTPPFESELAQGSGEHGPFGQRNQG